MEEAVSFRSMIESLSTNEFNQFSTKLFSKFNERELLTQSIFHLLAYQGRNALNTKYTKNINKILTTIIHSRDKETTTQKSNDQNENEDDEDIDIEGNKQIKKQSSITDLSYHLIANIGSYLLYKELIKFQLSNRHIYISCKNNLSCITKLSTSGWYNCYISNNFGSSSARIKQLKQFKHAKSITFNAKDFGSITNKGKNMGNFVWKSINNLIIKNLYGSIFNAATIPWTKTYANILQSQKQMTHLSIEVCSAMKLQSIFTLLTCNQTMKYLSLNTHFGSSYIKINQNEDITDMIKQYDFSKINLSGFSMNDFMKETDIPFMHKVLLQIAGKLESYHTEITKGWDNMDQFSSLWEEHGQHYKLTNLRELDVSLQRMRGQGDDSNNSMETLKKSIGSKLERLQIRSSLRYTTENDWTTYSQFINYILMTKKMMKYFCFVMDNGSALRVICDYLKNTLKENNNLTIYKDIGFEFKDWSRERYNQQTFAVVADYRQIIEENLFEFICIIDKAVSGNFVIKFENPWMLTRNDNLAERRSRLFETKIENLKISYNVDTATVGKGYGSMDKYYIITNKNGELYGGYHAEWIMTPKLF